jgi:glycosyltransferase involved in cell wall biosynthesis
MPLRIAQLVPSLKPTGPVRVALDIAQWLEANGHQVKFFYIDDLPDAIAMQDAEQIGFWDNPGFHNFDVLHTHGLRPDAWLRLHKCRIPAVTTLHNYVARDLNLLYGKGIGNLVSPFWNWFTSKHEIRVVLSDDMRKYYQKRSWRKPLVVVPNSRPEPEALPDADLRDTIRAFAKDRIVLGNISHINPRKGLDQVLKMLAHDERFVFVHIGSNQAPLQAQAEEMGLSNSTLWLPARPDAASQIPLFHIFVMPSLSEGFPLALLEAVAAGVPAVVSDLPIFKEIFPEKALQRFALNDTNALQTAIYSTLENPQEQAHHALQHYHRHYHPNVVGKMYEQVYWEALNKSL